MEEAGEFGDGVVVVLGEVVLENGLEAVANVCPSGVGVLLMGLEEEAIAEGVDVVKHGRGGGKNEGTGAVVAGDVGEEGGELGGSVFEGEVGNGRVVGGLSD